MILTPATDEDIFMKIRAFTLNEYHNKGDEVLPNRAWLSHNLLLFVDDYTRSYALDLATSKFVDQLRAL